MPKSAWVNFRERLVELRFLSVLAISLRCSSSVSELLSVDDRERLTSTALLFKVAVEAPPETWMGSVSPARRER